VAYPFPFAPQIFWICENLAPALLRFLWQGAAIGFVVLFLTWLLRQRSAQSRYVLNLTGLLALSLCIPVTLFFSITNVARQSDQQANRDAAPPLKNILPATVSEPNITQATPIVRPSESPETGQSDVPDVAVIPATQVLESSGTDKTSPRGIYVVANIVTSPVVLVNLWFLGVIGMLLRLCRGVWRGHQLRSASTKFTETWLLNLVTAQADQLRMKATPVLLRCEQIAIPMVIGLLNPIILLPPALIAGLDSEQLRAILAHEMAHIRRWDPWVNLFQHGVESFLFFHPVVWWLSSRIRAEREICCDDLVVASGCESLTYAGALIRAAEVFSEQRHRSVPPNVTALRADGKNQSQLNCRIRKLLGEPQSGEPQSGGPIRLWPLLSIVAFTMSVTIGVAAIQFGRIDRDIPGIITADASAIGIEQPTIPSTPAEAWRNPQWGFSSRRNHVTNIPLPLWFDEETKYNICWAAPLGQTVNSTPVVAGGKVFIGTSNAGYNDRYPQDTVDLGCLVCLHEETGELFWQYSVPKRRSLNDPRPFTDWPLQGICSAPCVNRFRQQGGRLWVVNNLAQVVCLDIDGFTNGNDGPVTDEADTGLQDADVIWRFDMFEELGVRPGYMACTSPTLAGNVLLLNTTHSVQPDENRALPEATKGVPSFIALHCDTGELIWQDESATANILDFSWSSPAFDVIAGIPQAIFAGGDGWLYSFDARDIAKGNSNLLWSFDCNPKTAKYLPGGQGDRNTLIATPVIHENRVFIATGRSLENGDGPGIVWCVDATKRGDLSDTLVFNPDSPNEPIPHRRLLACDIAQGDYTQPNPNTGVIWKFDGADINDDGRLSDEETMHRAVSCVTVKDHIAVVTDSMGIVHCLDADTGGSHWNHDLSSQSAGTPLISRDRILVGDQDGNVTMFKLDRRKAVMAKVPTKHSIQGSLTATRGSAERLWIAQSGQLLCASPLEFTSSDPTTPKGWQISDWKGSVKVFQSERQLHFVVYCNGSLSSGMCSSSGMYSWGHDGHLHLIPLPEQNREVRLLAIKHDSDDPQSVLLDGQRYDLRNGRLFAVDRTGVPRQLQWNRRFERVRIGEVAKFVAGQNNSVESIPLEKTDPPADPVSNQSDEDSES